MIDLSNNNAGRVNFKRLFQAGQRRVYLKATEGLNFTDSTFALRRTAARANKFKVGAYHFAHTDEDPVKQMQKFREVVGPIKRGSDLRPVIDFEYGNPSGTWLVKAVSACEKYFGVRPLVYSYSDFLARAKLSKAVADLWLASYGRNDGKEYPFTVPLPWRYIVAHQFASSERMVGVEGQVDISHVFKPRKIDVPLLSVHRIVRNRKPPAPQPIETMGAAGKNWVFTRNSNEYAGDHPPFNWLRQLKITGVAFEASDAALAQGVAAAKQAGFDVAVWAHYADYGEMDKYITALKSAYTTAKPSALLLDVETEAKREQGQAAYDLSKQIVTAVSAAFPNVECAVVPLRSDTDFDFTAYTNAGWSVLIQTYGANPQTDLLDPIEVIQLAEASGVPKDYISPVLSPMQLPAAIPKLHASGIHSYSIFTTDGLNDSRVSATAALL